MTMCFEKFFFTFEVFYLKNKIEKDKNLTFFFKVSKINIFKIKKFLFSQKKK